MKKQALIRIGFILFLFTLGFLVGAGLSKTVRYLTGKTEPVTYGYMRIKSPCAAVHPAWFIHPPPHAIPTYQTVVVV